MWRNVPGASPQRGPVAAGPAQSPQFLWDRGLKFRVSGAVWAVVRAEL